MKRFWKFCGITLLVILGIVVLLFVLMLIIPEFKLFNHQYVKRKTTTSIVSNVTIDSSSNYYLVIVTESFDIEITENATLDTITVQYEDSKWGMANIPKSSLAIKENDNIIEMNMLEKSGLLFGSGKLKITMPNTKNVILDISTGKGNININKKQLLGLTATMDSGSLTWVAKQTVQVANPKKNPDDEAEEITYSEVEQNIEEMQIDSFNIFGNNATVDLSCFKNFSVNGRMLISANKLDLNFDTLTADLYINADSLNLTVKTLNENGDLNIISKSGKIAITTLNSTGLCNIYAQKSNVNIANNNSELYVRTSSGNAEVSTSNNKLNIVSTSGRVIVNTATADCVVKTTSGDINIAEYYRNMTISTESGNISAHDKGEENSAYRTNIIQDTGNINHITEANTVSIVSNKGSNITVTIRKMCLNTGINHSIINKYGTTRAYIMTTNNPFKIRAVGNDVYGELGSIVVVNSNTNYIDYVPENYFDNTTNVSSINVEGGVVRFTGIYE